MRNKVIQNGWNKSNFVSIIPYFSMNPASQEYFDAANGLIGRGQMGQMNFFLFTIFYADKYGDKCYNQIVTTKPLQMGIIEKFKGDNIKIIRIA